MTKLNSNNSIRITALTEQKFDAWLDLWQGYLTFYETSLPMQITNATWQKLMDDNTAVFGFGAFQDDGLGNNRLVGIVHAVIHPNTWNETDCCYLEDLFVSESVRGQGVGRALIEHIYQFASEKNCNRVYWVTQDSNQTARRLYDTLATQTDMIQYRKDL